MLRNRIKEYRARHNMKQEELARQAVREKQGAVAWVDSVPVAG